MTLEDGSNVIWDHFRKQAERLADRIAVSAMGGDITFGRLYTDAADAAERLTASGIGPGDVVGHAMKNGAEFVIAYLALCKLSATTALIPEKYQQAELDLIRTHLRPKCFLVAQSQFDSFSRKLPAAESQAIPLASGGESLRVVYPGGIDGRGEESSAAADDRVDGAPIASNPQTSFGRPVALIKFTSGSTGTPKAVALSAGNILAETANVVQTLNLGVDDRILAPLPLSHSYGFDLGVLAMLGSGARLFVHEGFIPRKVLRDLEQQSISVFLGVPSMYKLFLETHVDHQPDLSGVRYLLSCTAPLGVKTIEEFHARFGVWICQHYGSSETGAAANHRVDEIADHPEAVGQAMNNVHIRIVDADGRTAPSGEDGEVVISGEAVALGYLMGRPNGREPLRDGMYWTGDIGCLDERGFLHITGRLDQMINVGGHKVSPEEVAALLESHPAVREAAVMGMKDASGDDVVVAVAAVRDPVDEETLLAFCRGRLAVYKVPRRVVFMPELPKGPTGKVRISAEDIIL
jgi:acyl-CoA synthetase (AMP-forming)/AMP-acid ligase II